MTTRSPEQQVKSDRTLPLSGVKILDISHVLAGPFTTYQLALLGADVIRVERIMGDDFVRSHGGTDEMKAHGLGASFLSQNACKRSIAIDLKKPEGIEIILRLAKTTDIFMENFRPGVVERLGIGFKDIAAVNNHIIYCSLSGYGPTGPLAKAPAYDHILQGISGLMAMTGTADSGPMRVGLPIVDYIAGQTAAFAILSALIKHRTYNVEDNAKAEHLNISMLDSLLSFMGAYAVDYQTTGTLRGLDGNEAFSGSPFSGRFDTAEGQIVVTANTTAQEENLCTALKRPDLLERSRSPEIHPRHEITEILQNIFQEDTAEVWEIKLNTYHVPAAKVRNLAEILDHAQVRNEGSMQHLKVPEVNQSVLVPGLGFKSTNWDQISLNPAPTLGRDTKDVLKDHAYSATEIQELLQNKVIA